MCGIKSHYELKSMLGKMEIANTSVHNDKINFQATCSRANAWPYGNGVVRPNLDRTSIPSAHSKMRWHFVAKRSYLLRSCIFYRLHSIVLISENMMGM